MRTSRLPLKTLHSRALKKAFCLTLSFAVLSLGLTSCSWFQGEEKKSGVDALLRSIPDNALGFAHWQSSGDTFTRFQKSPWANLSEEYLETGLQGLKQKELQKAAELLLEVSKKTGLLRSSPQQPTIIAEGLAVVVPKGQEPSSGASIALLLEGVPGASMSEKLDAIRSVFYSKNMPVEEVSPENQQTKLFRVDLSGALSEEQQVVSELFFAARANMLSMGEKQETVASLLRPQPDAEHIPPLLQTPRYKRAQELVEKGKEELGFAYLDLEKALPYAAASQPQSPRSQAKVPDTKNSPLLAAAFSRKYSATLHDRAIILVQAKTEGQRKALQTLSSSIDTPLSFAGLPQNALLSIALPGDVVNAAKNAKIRELPVDEQEGYRLRFAATDGLKAFRLALLSGGGASPFPGLIAQLESSASESLQTLLEDEFLLLLQSFGFASQGWQTKEVAGAEAKLFMTPFGLGVFLAHNTESAFIASSEMVLAGLLREDNHQASIESGLSSTAKDLLQKKKSVLVGYVNFTAIAEELQSAQQMLAMFTGGEAMMDDAQLETLRKNGKTVFRLGLKDNETFELDTVYLPHKAK